MVNVHIYPSPLTHESRMLRITDALARAGIFREIELVGVLGPGLATCESVDAHRTLVRLPRKWMKDGDGLLPKLVRTVEWSARVALSMRGRAVTCINAHSLSVLPLCVMLKWMTGARLVYDTHELETETHAQKGLRQKLARFTERVLIRRCDLVFVVSDGIADWYARTYGIERPVVVRNVPQFKPPAVADDPQARERRGLVERRLACIYQGGFLPGRGVERLLRVFSATPQVDLVCMGSGALQPVIDQSAAVHPNVHRWPAVPPSEVLRHTRRADVGLCLTQNTCLSYYYSLPNKLFEYLHAGLPVIVTPLPEQQRLVEEFGCGWIAPADDAAFAELLGSIGEAELAGKREGVARAAQALDWNEEEARLVRAYREHGFV